MAGKRDGVFPFTNRGVDIKTKEVVSVRACVCVCVRSYMLRSFINLI